MQKGDDHVHSSSRDHQAKPSRTKPDEKPVPVPIKPRRTVENKLPPIPKPRQTPDRAKSNKVPEPKTDESVETDDKNLEPKKGTEVSEQSESSGEITNSPEAEEKEETRIDQSEQKSETIVQEKKEPEVVDDKEVSEDDEDDYTSEDDEAEMSREQVVCTLLCLLALVNVPSICVSGRQRGGHCSELAGGVLKEELRRGRGTVHRDHRCLIHSGQGRQVLEKQEGPQPLCKSGGMT